MFLWLSDIHLNDLSAANRLDYYQSLAQQTPTTLLISGDIAEAPSLQLRLSELQDYTGKTIFFVLGNHDYYDSSVESLKRNLSNWLRKQSKLKWLSTMPAQLIAKDCILAGQDTWADGRYGDYWNSEVRLNDSSAITELMSANFSGKLHLLQQMQKFADSDAAALKKQVTEGIETNQPTQVIILIHVPPFVEACLHQDKPSSKDFLPFFASKVTGDTLNGLAATYPAIHFTALCGHTHAEANYQVSNNLLVKVAAASYGAPAWQEFKLKPN